MIDFSILQIFVQKKQFTNTPKNDINSTTPYVILRIILYKVSIIINTFIKQL